jgi:hypothetical protein
MPESAFRLDSKPAILVGAALGIGRAIALAFADAGAIGNLPLLSAEHVQLFGARRCRSWASSRSHSGLCSCQSQSVLAACGCSADLRRRRPCAHV